MITVIVFISFFIVYITYIFFRGVHREKKARKHKKIEDPLNEEENEI